MNTDRTSEKLKLFRIAINHQADEDIAVINKDAMAKHAAAKNAEKTASNDELKDLRTERARVESKLRKDISKCDYDMKKAVLAHRAGIIDGFFDELKEQLKDFAASEVYAEYLKRCLDKIRSSISLDEDTVVCARECDVELVRTLTSCKVTADNSIILGGLTAWCKEKNLFVDASLDSALAAEKEAFSAKAELRL